MKSRIVSMLMVGCLFFVVGVRPCMAWMMEPATEVAHDCCDTPGEHSHDQQSDCEAICAIANSRFLPADKPNVEKQQLLAFAAPTVVESLVRAVSYPPVRPAFRPPDHTPPLYVLNAAFLI